MSKVIIHIGLHKTATSFLQREIFPQIEDVIYATNNEFFVPWQNQVKNSNKYLFLSYEGFSGNPWNMTTSKAHGISNCTFLESFEKNINALSRYFPNASIIVFFRRHGDWVGSLYKQYLHEGGTLDFNEFYGESRDSLLTPSDLIFSSRIKLLQQLFNNVHIIDYDDFKNGGGVFIETFFNNIFNLYFQKPTKTEKHASNKGVSGVKMKLLRKYNKIYHHLPKSLKRPLIILRLTPRKIFQEKLKFWKTSDSIEFISKLNRINDDFKADWEIVLNQKWNPQNGKNDD